MTKTLSLWGRFVVTSMIGCSQETASEYFFKKSDALEQES